MRNLVFVVLGLVLTASAAAQDLGPQAPVKVPQAYPENIPNPIRQGGDTIATATVIPALPYSDSGTTVGRVERLRRGVPVRGSTAPDVVYKYVAPATLTTCVDLCGSSYDTKVYVYDEQPESGRLQ